MTNLIFGGGYLGERVAQRWRDVRNNVIIVTRRPERAEHFAAQGYHALVADVTRPDTLRQLPEADSVLFSIGFDQTNGQSIHEVYAGGVQNILSSLPAGVGRFIYISTTGVYGSADGEWIDERTLPDPQRDGGRASLAAEQVLAAHPLGRRSVILRLAGIYGPGRVPFIDKLRACEPIPAPVDGYLNLIHVDDAASAVMAAAAVEPFDDGPRVYCVSDGNPVNRGDYYREVARQIGAPPPAFVPPVVNSPRTERAAINRRVRNARMLIEMGFQLRYPDYRAGLSAILETQNQ
jgi:nucleoside-diphosphate-sugar epimerase